MNINSMDDTRRMVLKRLQRLNPQGIGLGDPVYSTDVLLAVCDVLEGRVETEADLGVYYTGRYGNPSVQSTLGDAAHRLGRVHDGMRWCMDKGCNWGRPARRGES